MSKRMNGSQAELGLGPSVHSLVPVIQALNREMAHARPSESPRDLGVDNLLKVIRDLRHLLRTLRTQYPEPEMPSPSNALESARYLRALDTGRSMAGDSKTPQGSPRAEGDSPTFDVDKSA